MNNKILLTGLVLASITGTTMAAGLDNTVDSTAAHYGAEAYGYTNTITETGRSAFVIGYNNTVSANNALAYGNGVTASGINSLAGGELAKANGRNSLAIGSSAEANNDNTFAIGSQARTNGVNTVAIGNGSYASNANALAVGYSTAAEGKDSVAVGSYIQSKSQNNVAIGNNITTNDKDSVSIGSTVTTNSNNSVGIGSMVTTNKKKSIAIGNGVATDFNTVGIGNGVETKVKDTIAIGNGVKSNGESSVAIGNGIHADGVRTVNIGTNVNTTGVSSIVVGRDTTVNGDDTTVVGANNRTIDAAQSAVFGYNNTVEGAGVEQLIFGTNSTTKAQGAVVVGTHGQATAIDAIAIGNNTLADNANSVALGTNSVTDAVINTTSATIGGKVYNFAGTNALSTVSVGSNSRSSANGAADYKRTITNVAAGRVSATSTDAVNGSQLNATVEAINKNHNDILDTAKGLEMLGDIVADHETQIAANKQAAADAMAEAKKHVSVTAGDNVIVTTGTNANGGVEYKVATKKDVDLNSVSFGSVSDPVHNVITKDGMGVFNGDVDTQYKANGMIVENRYNLDNATHDINGVTADSNGRHVAFTTDGIDAGSQIINNVKAGTTDTDAVNVSQLKRVENSLDNKINDVGRNALNQANRYTDLQVNKGVAKASALAGLKYLDYNPRDKWSFAASVGHYRNANAVAVGAAYQPNENTMVHGGITLDGKVAYNLGVSFKTGGQKQVTRQELEEQIRQLENNNIRMQEELNEIRAMLEKK